MHTRSCLTALTIVLALGAAAACAAPAADEQQPADSSAAAGSQRVAPADVSSGSRTIQLLLDLQANKPSTFDAGAGAVRRDDGGSARPKPQAALPPQFGLPGAPVAGSDRRRAAAVPTDVPSARSVEWSRAGAMPSADGPSVHQQDAAPSFDGDRPGAHHLAWLSAGLGLLREHRGVVLGACAVVIGLVWLGAAKGSKHKRR